MSNSPKISVCIPTFNRARYLGAALESVFRQTEQDWELVIYDDASTDETAQIVSNFADPRVRYLCQPHNVGIARNRNSCIRAAHGKYIAWLDSDDLVYPQMLAIQSRVLDYQAAVGIVHGHFSVIDANGNELPRWPQPFAVDTIEPGHDAFRELAVCNYVSTPTAMVRRSCYEHVGWYSEELGNYCEDWEMWMRIALHYDLAFTASPVAAVRWHQQSMSTATQHAGQCSRAELRAVRRVFGRFALGLADHRRLRRMAHAAVAAKSLLRSGEARLRGYQRIALSEALVGLNAAPWLIRSRHSWRLLAAIEQQHEIAEHSHSKALLQRLNRELVGTRYGDALASKIRDDPAWTCQLREIARTVRKCVPQDASVAIVDKWDPTLLALSERTGWHFPDLTMCPSGYPVDSEGAIAHLKQLMQLGAGYLVFTSASMWWLEYYSAFRQYLDGEHRRAWADDRCVVFDLRN